jgi:hypothetical protein
MRTATLARSNAKEASDVEKHGSSAPSRSACVSRSRRSGRASSMQQRRGSPAYLRGTGLPELATTHPGAAYCRPCSAGEATSRGVVSANQRAGFGVRAEISAGILTVGTSSTCCMQRWRRPVSRGVSERGGKRTFHSFRTRSRESRSSPPLSVLPRVAATSLSALPATRIHIADALAVNELRPEVAELACTRLQRDAVPPRKCGNHSGGRHRPTALPPERLHRLAAPMGRASSKMLSSAGNWRSAIHSSAAGVAITTPDALIVGRQQP